jgi:endogenous inhibitor of DNA gyrase (YacG/DUF329 family)
MPLFPVDHHNTKTAWRVERKDFVMSYLTPRRTRSEQRREAPRVHARTRRLDCASCGKPITHRAGRRPSYCSARCRMREFGKGRSRKTFLGRDTGAPTKHPKISSNNNSLQVAKIRSRTRIVGPTSVLTIEVFDRGWQSQTSSGGVAIEVAQLRPRALINWGRQ